MNLSGWILAGSVAISAAGSAAADESISRETPEACQSFLEELLSREEILDLPAVPKRNANDDPESESLIRHTFARVNEDGSSVTLYHQARRLLKESGRDDFSTKSFSIRPDKQTVHIIKARTILPDGETVPVEDNAIFLEQPQGDSDTLFTDRKQVRIVYPKTRPGAVVETVFAIVEEPIIPGHWSYATIWNRIEPLRNHKLVIDCPASLADDLIWDQAKVDAKPVRGASDDGRVRFTWEESALESVAFQVGMPSAWQRGPYLRVALGENWDRFGKWFAGLVEEASEEVAPLEAIAEEWAGDAAKPREIAAKLFEKVSREIRYTGLEFGDGAFRPRDATAVLETRYGDCKDKSNLLRLLLAAKGIPSRIALLPTMRPGEVSRKIASASLFDHAILAVDLPGAEETVLCDPTLDGVPFGLLSHSVQGNDILIVDSNGSLEWTKAPFVEPNVVKVKADLEIDPNGAYSGWFEVKVSGVPGWMLRRHFESIDREQRLKESVNFIFSFVGGLRLVDGAPVESSDETEDPPFHYRFYGIQSAESVEASDKTARFSFPAVRSLITPVGEKETRVQPFLITPIKTEIETEISLPRGWEVLDHPAAFDAEGDGFKIEAEWSAEGARLTGKAVMHRLQREYSPRQHQPFADAVREQIQWLMTSVLLKREPPDDDESEGWTADPALLPKMPNPDGFTALIQERFPFDPQFPFDADHDSRLAAYRRMETLYPDDDLGQFTSRMMVQVSRLFTFPSEKESRDIVKKLKRLTARFEDSLDPARLAAAELIVAAALNGASEVEATIEICERLMKREDVTEQIHHGAAAILSGLIAEEQPERAADFAKLALESRMLPDLEWMSLAALVLDCTARKPGVAGKEIGEEMEWILETWPDRVDDLKETFLEGPALLVYFGHHEEAGVFRDVLTEKAETFEYGEDDLEPITELFEKLEKVEPLHRQLSKYLKANPWPDLDRIEKNDVIESALDCVDVYAENSAVEFRYLLRGLIHYGSQPDFSDRVSELFETADYWFNYSKMDSKETPPPPDTIEPLLDTLLALWKRSPDGDYADSSDAIFAEGTLIERRHGLEKAGEFFTQVAGDEAVDDYSRLSAISRISGIREEQGDLAGYLAALQMMEPFTEVPNWRNRRIVEGAYLSLANGKREEAWRRFELAAGEKEVEGFPDGTHRYASEFVENRKRTSAWWESSDNWWPLWLAVAEKLKLKPDPPDEWSRYSPWYSPRKKAINRLEKIEPGKKRKGNLKKHLVPQLEFARWHWQGAESAVRLLRLAAGEFPAHQDELEELAALIEAAVPSDPE